MRPLHIALAILVAVIWGIAFVATKFALDSFSPPQLTALRFLLSAVPVLFLPRPPIPWSWLIWLGLTLFTGQFLFQFFGIAAGMQVGLAAVVVQTQAFFTVALAAALLRERPDGRQLTGMLLGAAGLVLIATTVGGDLSFLAFALTMVSPISFAIGNILLKRVGPVDMVSLMAWLSLVPPLPSLLLSLVLDGPADFPRALADASFLSWAAVFYLAIVSTTFGYAVWGDLVRRYPAAIVAPFPLLVPFVGAAASALILGDRFGPLRLAGMACVLVGLAIIAWPKRSSDQRKAS